MIEKSIYIYKDRKKDMMENQTVQMCDDIQWKRDFSAKTCSHKPKSSRCARGVTEHACRRRNTSGSVTTLAQREPLQTTNNTYLHIRVALVVQLLQRRQST